MKKKGIVYNLITGLKLVPVLILAGAISTPLMILIYFAGRSQMYPLIVLAGAIYILVGLVILGWSYLKLKPYLNL